MVLALQRQLPYSVGFGLEEWLAFGVVAFDAVIVGSWRPPLVADTQRIMADFGPGAGLDNSVGRHEGVGNLEAEIEQ